MTFIPLLDYNNICNHIRSIGIGQKLKKKGEINMSRIKAVCIGRQYASGGSEIGKIVARKLQAKCYDHELVDMAIERSGISAEEFCAQSSAYAYILEAWH